MAADVRCSERKPALPVAQDIAIPMDGMRRTIAARMMESLHGMAQANHRMEVDMHACVRLREELKANDIKISFNDMVLLCTAKALREHPGMNAVMGEDAIIQRKNVNLGMAVATERGLLVPVLPDADKLSLQGLSAAARDLGQRAKTGAISPDELTGGTFTVSNLGMYGIDSFTAIINAPEAGILAVGAIKQRPVVLQDGSIAARPMMWLCLTYDHRIVDGAPAAAFLARVKALLETPALLL